jgi:hypothetical protein
MRPKEGASGAGSGHPHTLHEPALPGNCRRSIVGSAASKLRFSRSRCWVIEASVAGPAGPLAESALLVSTHSRRIS